MLRNFLLLGFTCGVLLITGGAQAQSNALAYNTSYRATAAADYMTSEERELLALCNLARTNGKVFTEQYLKPYFAQDTLRPEVAALMNQLRKKSKLVPLAPSKHLHMSAARHANEMGRTGKTGTQGLDGQPYYDRIHRYFPYSNTFAENYHAGSSRPVEIVMELLLDTASNGAAQRQNILSGNLNVVGIALRPHKTECGNTVMDFSLQAPENYQPAYKATTRKASADLDCPPKAKVVVRKKNRFLFF
jgi:uncharacterized protein YkwD